jgi:SAM-dependent methyltransferase
MEIIERDWDWWAYFWRVKHRQTISGIDEYDKKVIEFIIKILGIKPGESLLDLGCGSGEHTRLLAKEGIRCVGIEIAPSLVKYAKNKAKEEKIEVEYIQKDMREIDFCSEFECCILIDGTFGFFNGKANLELLKKIEKALKLGGRLLLDCPNPYRTIGEGRTKSWWKVENGYVLEKGEFDTKVGGWNCEFFFIDKDGRMNILKGELGWEFTRIYTLPEIRDMLNTAGMQFLKAYENIEFPYEEYKMVKKGDPLL